MTDSLQRGAILFFVLGIFMFIIDWIYGLFLIGAGFLVLAFRFIDNPSIKEPKTVHTNLDSDYYGSEEFCAIFAI